MVFSFLFRLVERWGGGGGGGGRRGKGGVIEGVVRLVKAQLL